MSRIEQALHRIGKEGKSAPSSTGATAQDVFESPWVFQERTPGSEPNLDVPPEWTRRVPIRPESEPRLTDGFAKSWIERLVIAPQPNPILVEQFRNLAATLHHAQSASNTRVLMITSAEPGEGKSITAVNLALTLSESYRRRVLLLDADLRRPSLHEIAGLRDSHGLGDTLRSGDDQKLPMHRVSERLMLVPAGRADGDPMSALTSRRMQHILEEAATRFDWVLLDASPLAPVADATLLASMVDAIVLVVRAGRTSYVRVQKAVEVLGRDRIIGVVLNGAEVADQPSYQTYYDVHGIEASGTEG